MRIVLLLAAAGAFALATSAPARPGGKPGGPGGPGGPGRPGGPGISPPGWAANPGHGRARRGWAANPGHGRPGRPDRHGERGRDYPDGAYYGGGYGGGFAVGGLIQPYGSGFFARGGGAVLMNGDRPHYDYDRSYPYEFASRGAEPPQWEEEARPPEPRPRCTLEHGVRVCRGW